MMFEKQILSVLRNEVGPDSCNTVLLAGDMNNDGWNDIVVCGKNGRLALLKNGERYRRWERYILDENVEGVGGAATWTSSFAATRRATRSSGMKIPARTRRANGSSAWPLPRGTAALPTWSWPTTCWATAGAAC